MNKNIEYSANKEIIDLWIEVTYLRLLLAHIFPHEILQVPGKENFFQQLSDESIRIVGKKFGVTIPKQEQIN